MKGRATGPDIVGAEKKLRQAKLFLWHLTQASAVPLRRAGQEEHDAEVIEAYFSACLSTAQSVYTVLEHTGGATFQSVQAIWLMTLPAARERSWFKYMKRLRGEDVHFAVIRAESLPKYVPEDRISGRPESPYYQRPPYNAALFGPAPVIKETNPDGVTVTGPVLHGAVGLYIKHQGRRMEVPDVCARFIDQLASLVEAMKAHTR